MIFAFCLLLTGSTLARAASSQQAIDHFAANVDLAPLRTMAVMDQQTVKTFDSYCRQMLQRITGASAVGGQDPVFTVIDIANHPADYQSVNLIKVGNVPLLMEFQKLPALSAAERQRIASTGMVSLELLNQPEVEEMFARLQSGDIRKTQAIDQVKQSANELRRLSFSITSELLIPAQVVPPASRKADGKWHRLIEMVWNDPKMAARAKLDQQNVPDPLPGYLAPLLQPALHAAVDLRQAWRVRDAAAVNTASNKLVDALAQLDPAEYPSQTVRTIEVMYNRFAKLTLPGAACYFFAMVCFLMSTRTGLARLRLWGVRLLVLGFAIHSAGIAVRWVLEGSIPIKNEFESVMFSAWFGVAVGLMLELRMQRSFLGAAAGFVGWLSLLALFTVPNVFHVSIGENIGQVNGVLMSYWLYIHVTMVTASYSMIGMAFLLGSWWLIKYYMNRASLTSVSSDQLDGQRFGSEHASAGNESSATKPPIANFLTALDACNLVVLQLAFWTLGIGIVLGAIWADQSWGRFWAWDPKETFALVTWIAYLVIVHVRVATAHKAWWTAALSIVGFFLMLFNWIGVNYFLPGLHSYAG